MSVLVTGGAGFIGSHIVDELIRHGFEHIIVLDDLSGGKLENLSKNVKFICGSVVDNELIKKIFKENKIDYVYHLAAYAAENLSHHIKHFNYTNNLIGSINLINATINNDVKCFVFTSSAAVYGAGQTPMTEDQVPIPEDSYGIAKYAVEQELRISHDRFGLNYIIFRPHNVFGERQNIGDKYRNVIGIFMNQIMKKEPLTIFGDGEQTRAFTYISNIASSIARSVEYIKVYNNTFNIGSDLCLTVNQIAYAVAEEFGVKLDIKYLSERNEVKCVWPSHDKFYNTFGDSNKYTVGQGLHNMAEWAKSIGPQQEKKFNNIEIYKNLPPSWL